MFSQDSAQGPGSHIQLPKSVTVSLEDPNATYYLVVANVQTFDTYPECLAREGTNSESFAMTSDIPSKGSVRDGGGCDQYIQRPKIQ